MPCPSTYVTKTRDLEGLMVPWSRDLTSPKVLGLENWKSPGTMETLIHTYLSMEQWVHTLFERASLFVIFII